MKVAISSTGNRPQDLIHSQFGRCKYFLIFEDSSEKVKVIENPYAEAETGAGIGCAQDLIQEGVKAVISVQVGPKAYEVLNAVDIEIYLAPPNVSVQDAYEKFLSKKLRKMEIKMF